MPQLELPFRLRAAPWLLSRQHVLGLPSRALEFELEGRRRRVESRSLAGREVLLLNISGSGSKALLPLPWLATLARVSPRKCLHLETGTIYRYVQVDTGFAIATADVALTVLPLAPVEKEPAPQTA